MPRILNAKQLITGSAILGIPVPGQKFVLLSEGNSGQRVVVREDSTLGTPFASPAVNTVPFQSWILVETNEEGVFHIQHVQSKQFVLEGHRPDPVRVGTGDPVAVRISDAGDGTFVIKAPNENLVWTLVPSGAWGHIEYKEADGSVDQLWRFIVGL